MSDYQIGATEATLAAVSTLTGVPPRSTYAPGGERVRTVAGTQVDVGYPRVTWTFRWLTVAQWNALLTVVGGVSGMVYVETRDDVDAWSTYYAIANLPNVAELERWGGGYMDVQIEMILLEEIT